VIWYLPFLLLSGCVTGLFTGLVAEAVVRHWDKRAAARTTQQS
jgi:NhaP-type Na+/H+ or K+/H+ antiporter